MAEEAETREQPLWRRVWEELGGAARSLLYFIPLYLIFTTTAFGNYVIPSESMVPTLEVGDRIAVSKYAYGYSRHSLPLNIGALLPESDERLFERMPARGDVVVFINPQNGRTMIKRLIGLPGDRVEVRRGRLILNGEPVPLGEGQQMTREAHRYGAEDFIRRIETLPNGVRHTIHEFDRATELDEYGPRRIPDDHFFFMGDNRDNSYDSRWDGLGLVPIENLIGRADVLYFAAPRCRIENCPERQRWLRPLHD